MSYTNNFFLFKNQGNQGEEELSMLRNNSSSQIQVKVKFRGQLQGSIKEAT